MRRFYFKVLAALVPARQGLGSRGSLLKNGPSTHGQPSIARDRNNKYGSKHFFGLDLKLEESSIV